MAAPVILEVAEATNTKDVGRGIVRVDSAGCNALGVTIGDTVKIVGKRTTSAKVFPAYPVDVDLKLIRMDGFIRKSCDVGITDTVRVSKVVPEYASSITLVPVDIKISVDEDFIKFIKDRLGNRTVSAGDLFPIMMLGHTVLFKVAKITPGGILKIKPTTNLKILGEPEGSKRVMTVRLVVAKDDVPFEVRDGEKLVATSTLTKIETSNDKGKIETPYALMLWFAREVAD